MRVGKLTKLVCAATWLAAISTLSIGTACAQSGKAIVEWDHQTGGDEPANLQAAVARFEQANPGNKVESSHVLNDPYKAKLKIAFGAAQPPCVFDSWGGGGLREYVTSGQVADLTPFLKQNPAFESRFLPTSWTAVTTGGKIYGIPEENIAVAVVFYNKDLFRKYHLSPPTTWPELMNVVKVFNAHGVAPFALANKNKWTGSMYYMYLVDRLGGPGVFQRAVNGGGSFTDPAFVEAGKMIQDLVKAGGFAPGYNGLDYDIGGSRRLLYSGRAAMELMGTWEASTIRKENPSFYQKLDFFPFPSVPGGKGDPRDVVGTVGDSFLSISAQCEDKAAAFKLIETMTDDAAMKGRVADDRIPPIKDVRLSDPLMKRVQALIEQAPSVQLWYDQELPPRLGERHKDLAQALFGLSITPEAAAEQMQEAAKSAAN
ncbi:ABC transporter substrate-binding protein [Trinickia dabaoshanensis]|uniref:ABC transporter substrate-binding protein n=1 Tax=Trinickia dabaoshanensis TaxID=564714 RepID=A0A2N7VRS6_9BURK|nr:extracellular solute-binding protein [Trinickia dabaoshanensis]PMS19832.1 ABC transporter substrate-binding protein [Trinickia dabaoshanensis]